MAQDAEKFSQKANILVRGIIECYYNLDEKYFKKSVILNNPARNVPKYLPLGALSKAVEPTDESGIVSQTVHQPA